MANITYRDPELEESFSFSGCYDFNSPFQSIFFDESDDESYIEIALEPSLKNGHGGINCWADEEMELRISFSSSAPFQELSTKKISNEHESAATMPSSPSSTTFTMSSSSPSMESGQRDAQMGSKASSSTCRAQKAIKKKVQFPKVNSFLNMLKPSLTVSSEADDGNGRPANNNHLELVSSRYFLYFLIFILSFFSFFLFFLRCNNKLCPPFFFFPKKWSCSISEFRKQNGPQSLILCGWAVGGPFQILSFRLITCPNLAHDLLCYN